MFNTYSNKGDEQSFFNSQLKIYAPTVQLRGVIDSKNTEIIKIKSDDFLGIRECNIAVLVADDLIEIGAALALHKRVITVGNVPFEHPLLKVFASWSLAIKYLQKMANSN